MIPVSFEYERASSVDEALDLLSGADASAIAGGHSLLPLMKLRLAQPAKLVDIGGLKELTGIEQADGGWVIGALTTYRQLLDHEGLMAAFPMLRDCVDSIGDVQVRNRGTVGGALAHADPFSDLAAAALALDGEVLLRSKGGERSVPVDGFFTGTFTTAIEPGELLIALRLPALPGGVGTAWGSLLQVASGYSLVGVAAVVGDAHGVLGSATMSHIRVGITGVAEAPYRAKAVEQALEGTDCNAADLAAAASHATEGQTVNSDIHADAEYRTSLTTTLVRRALEHARARAG
ncbi:MAG TPA: xanthine dehydrogenase family protein subunit M [Candidatus Limnocylindria bacterium]